MYTFHLPMLQNNTSTNNQIRDLAYKSLLELATDEGFNASAKEETFGCIFGRDSFIVILEILEAHSKDPHKKLLKLCQKALLTHVSLQAKETNIENGSQPGKFIHEYRKDKHSHLTGRQPDKEKPWENAWFLSDDGTLKSYDSIDSTPLALMALYKYWQVTKDVNFLTKVLPAVEAGLNWIISYGDLDKDFLIEYEFSPFRKHGGLMVQSWTDSHQSLRQKDGSFPKYPIAPVEAQGYGWLALKQWGNFYLIHSPNFGQRLLSQASQMKRVFNQRFLLKDQGLVFAAQALDGDKNQIKTTTANPLLLLWASYQKGNHIESIIDSQYIQDFVARVFLEDMFDRRAGFRTMSSLSKTYNPRKDSYHNGSFWPVLNGLIYEGLVSWNFTKAAEILKKASLKAVSHFESMIELYCLTDKGDYTQYRESSGRTGCSQQAWTAAVVLGMLTNHSFSNRVIQPFDQILNLILLPVRHLEIKHALAKSHHNP